VPGKYITGATLDRPDLTACMFFSQLGQLNLAFAKDFTLKSMNWSLDIWFHITIQCN
jgi:hypothetical protein